MFEEKTAEQLAEMDAQALSAYWKEKNAHDKEQLQKAIDAKATPADVAAMKATITENNNKQFDAINNALKEQGLAIGRIARGSKASKSMGLRDILSEKAEAFKSLLTKQDRVAVTLDTKVAGTMSIAGNVTGDIPQSERELGLNRIQRRRPFVAEYINSGSTSKNRITWVEQQNPDGGPAGTAEGVLKNEQDFDLVEAGEDVKKRTVFTKGTTELLDDIPYMESEIRTELLERLSLDVDNQLLQGDGTGTNLNGLITQATAWSAGSYALAVDNANNYDVLVVAMQQIKTANFFPTVIFVNSIDITDLLLAKATDGHYLKFPGMSEDLKMLFGVDIVENNGVPAGSFLIMDGSKASVFTRESIRVEMGRSGDDFLENKVSMLSEWRGLLRIKGNDTFAFVTGDFTTAKAALETP